MLFGNREFSWEHLILRSCIAFCALRSSILLRLWRASARVAVFHWSCFRSLRSNSRWFKSNHANRPR